jgi:hypothetical protein
MPFRMQLIIGWLKKRLKTFDLLPEYFTAAMETMQDVLWGGLLPFVVWGIWFILGNPPMGVNITALGIALFLAGYYAWRADHVRLQKTIEITRAMPQKWTDQSTNKPVTTYYFEVVNKSEASTIEWVSVQLEQMVPEVENLNWLPVPLHQKHDNPLPGVGHKQDFNLNPGQHKNIDLVSAFDGGSHFVVSHVVSGVNQEVLLTEKHSLQVTVTAKDTPSLSKWFDVWMNDSGILQCKICE